MGNQVVSRYEARVVPLLKPSEMETLAIESVLRMNTVKSLESKLGEPICSFTLYRKVTRVTTSIESNEYPTLMRSFDVEADHNNIIVNKILLLINEVGL